MNGYQFKFKPGDTIIYREKKSIMSVDSILISEDNYLEYNLITIKGKKLSKQCKYVEEKYFIFDLNKYIEQNEI